MPERNRSRLPGGQAERRRMQPNRYQSSDRPSSRSVSRRSRFVGRPVPRSRCGRAARTSRGGGGGLRSIMHWAAIGAPTRLLITRSTMTIRSIPLFRIRISSPGRTGCAGLAVVPFTRTCPPRQAAAAADRVLNKRTAQTQESTRAWVSPLLGSVAARFTRYMIRRAVTTSSAERWV